MTIVAPASDGSGAFEPLQSPGGYAQVLYPPVPFPNPLPATIAASSNWLSGLFFSSGFRNITVGVTSTQSGALNIQMYLDEAGTIARTLSTTAIVANTPLIVDLSAQPPFTSLTVQITNTSGSTAATVSGFQMILQAG